MFASGNFIKLVSDIGSFNNTESLFEVYSVDENGFIEFGNSCVGKGVMDTNAAEKHFRLATESEIEEYKNSVSYEYLEEDFEEETDENLE